MKDEEKWKAVSRSDNAYDGLFYYAVKTTGIFCRPSCKAKPPLKKNVIFFETSSDAINAGYRPCKMCRPDITEAPYEPNRELIKKAEEILKSSYHQAPDLNEISQQLGFSCSHFSRLFKHYYGKTVNQFVTELRLKEAMELLAATNKDIINIAFETGFKSLSNFYRCFKDRVGTTPQNYRENKKCWNK